jgi:hypothetical protein
VAFGERILREADLPDWRRIAQDYDGAESYPIPFHRQARIDLPRGWTGNLALPLWLWDIQGAGSVRIDGIVYTAGSEELVERLRYRLPVRSIEVLDSQDMSLIMQINIVRFDVRETNAVNLTGLDVWALQAAMKDIGANAAGAQWTYAREVAPNP